MEIRLNPTSILGSISELKNLYGAAANVATSATRARLDNSYSGVSGLDQLGGAHGNILVGGGGSALTVLNSYAEQIEWLSQALAASYQAVTGQNAFVQRGMDIADEGGAVGEDALSFPIRPMPRFESFSFLPPMVRPAASIEQLAIDFSTTRVAQSVAAAGIWKNLSAEVSSIAQSLSSVAGSLAGDNGGDVIDAAVRNIEQVARAGETFAQNAVLMGQSVDRLAAIKARGNTEVNATYATLLAITEPAAREAAEQTYLLSFPATFTPLVQGGVPPLRNLMDMSGGDGGGGEIALGMNDIDGTGAPHHATGLRAPGAPLDSLLTGQSAGGAGQFSTVAGETAELAQVGAVRAEDVLTTAASTGPATPTSMPVSAGMAPSMSPAGGSGFSGLAGLAPLAGNPALMRTTAASSTTGLPPSPGLPGAPGAVPLGGMAGSGRPVIPATGGVPQASGAGGPAPSAPPAATAAAVPGQRGIATGTAQTTPRGMMPMMGMPSAGAGAGAGQQQKTAKVKTVTSAVEEGDNIAALLGGRGPVVPGVIGAWVRQ